MGRPPACRPEGGGAGALVALWNRLRAFVGEPVPLVLCPSLEPLIEPPQTRRARMCKNEPNNPSDYA